MDAATVPVARRRGPLSEVKAAIGLLTRIPVHVGGEAAGASAFPLVGAAVGAVGMAPLLVLGVASPLIAAILALATTAILTGAIHLDAVADTADALMARDRTAAEQARRDPRLGTGGALALVFVVAVEAVALAEVVGGLGPAGAWVVAVLACAASRAAPVALSLIARDRVAADGSGAWFVRQVDALAGAVAVGTVVIVGGLAWAAVGGIAPWVALGGAVAGVIAGLIIVRLRGQLDGDGLGATTELSFAIALVAVAVLVA